MPDRRTEIRKKIDKLLVARRNFSVAEDVRGESVETDDYYEFDVSVASENPIDRGIFREGLDFRGMNGTWFNSGNAHVLWGHGRGINSKDNTYGKITRYKIENRESDSNRVIVATMRFFKKVERSMEMYNEIMAGLITNVSLGYRADWEATPMGESPVEWVENVPGSPAAGETQIWRYWRPTEVSFVDKPADESVGMGRSEDLTALRSLLEEELNMARETGTTDPEASDPVDNDGGDRTSTEDQDVTRSADGNTEESGERVYKMKDIKKAVRSDFVDLGVKEDKLDETIKEATERAWKESNGTPISRNDVIKAMYLIKEERTSEATSEVSGIPAERFSANVHTREHFADCGRMIDAVKENGDYDNLKGMERDVLDMHNERMKGVKPVEAIKYDAGNAPGNGSRRIIVPHALLPLDPNMRSWFEKNLKGSALDNYRVAFTGGTTGFSYPKFDETLVFAALKENAPMLRKVNYLPGMQYQNKVAIRVGGAATFKMTTAAGVGGEDANATPGITFGNPQWVWKNLSGHLDIQIQLLDQSNMVMPTIMDEKDRDFANAMDTQVINGSGGNNVTGILKLSGTNSIVTTGTNGEQLTYKNLSDFRASARASNARLGNAAWYTDAALAEKARRIPRITSGSAVTAQVVQDTGGEYPTIDGAQLVVDTNFPIDGTKGSGTDLRSMVYGDLSDMHVGMFSEFEVLIDEFTRRGDGNIRVWVRQAWDMVVGQAKNFTVNREFTNVQT